MTVLHDVNLAETKGTGIRAMHDSMREANLTVPLIESKRASNQFILNLLTHHLFDKKDFEWLGNLKDCHLSDEEARALIVIREMGAITNSDFRAINVVDMLTASKQQYSSNVEHPKIPNLCSHLRKKCGKSSSKKQCKRIIKAVNRRDAIQK